MRWVRFIEIAFFALLFVLFATVAFGTASIIACKAANTMCIVWHPGAP